MRYLLQIIFLVYLALHNTGAYSQVDSSRFKMIGELIDQIKTNYVSGEIAKRMCDTIRWKLDNGKYDSSLNIDEFAYEVTKDLRRVSNDLHINVSKPVVNWYAETPSNSDKLDNMNSRQRKRYYLKSKKKLKRIDAKLDKLAKIDMFSYGEIKILPGNIGYVEIKDFKNASHYRKLKKRIPIQKVMNYFKHTKAIIIDLRNNQGGSVKQAAKFCSFFSPSKKNYFISGKWHLRYDSSGVEKELSDTIRTFTSDKIDHSLTWSKTIYILISNRTFSSAEISAYKIKQYKASATVIGEKTQGGGNGHTGTIWGRYFFAVIPGLKSFDEMNGNYTLETKGVTPDTLTDAENAMNVAYALACKGDVPVKNRVKHLRKLKTPRLVNEEHVKKYYPEYIGNYGKVRIIREENMLYMLYDDFEKVLLIPQARDYFTADNIYAISFFRGPDGRVNEIKVRFTYAYFEQYSLQKAVN